MDWQLENPLQAEDAMENKPTDKCDFNNCTHPTLIMELAFGGPTGHFICLECERLLTANQAKWKQDDKRLIPMQRLSSVA